ncbi:MAG: metallophosphoesterase [Candidatus Bathyarchaeia archaeon]
MPHPAALLKTDNTTILVITDLHIGWEMALADSGIHVPTQTPKLLKKLKAIVEHYKPDELLIIGDVKHTVATAELSEWQDIPDFFNEVKKCVNRIQIVPGNHDGNLEPLLPEGVELLPSTGIAKDGIGFFHGHRWPSIEMLNCKILVMGHVHPIISLRDPAGFKITRQVWVRTNVERIKFAEAIASKYGIKPQYTREAFSKLGIKPRTSKLFIMPSFNDFLGGKPLNESDETANKDEILGPVLRTEAVKMSEAEIYLLDGTFLGTLNQLKLYT